MLAREERRRLYAEKQRRAADIQRVGRGMLAREERRRLYAEKQRRAAMFAQTERRRQSAVRHIQSVFRRSHPAQWSRASSTPFVIADQTKLEELKAIAAEETLVLRSMPPAEIVVLPTDGEQPFAEQLEETPSTEVVAATLAPAVPSTPKQLAAAGIVEGAVASTPEQLAAAGIVEDARSAGLDTSKAVPAWLANLDLPAPTAAALRAANEADAEVLPEMVAPAPAAVEPAAEVEAAEVDGPAPAAFEATPEAVEASEVDGPAPTALVPTPEVEAPEVDGPAPTALEATAKADAAEVDGPAPKAVEITAEVLAPEMDAPAPAAAPLTPRAAPPAPAISVEVLALYKEMFSAFDKDGNGTVSTSELAEMMSALGQTLSSEEELDEIIKEIDADGSGEIDFDEFCTCMQKAKKGSATAPKLAVIVEENDVLSGLKNFFSRLFIRGPSAEDISAISAAEAQTKALAEDVAAHILEESLPRPSLPPSPPSSPPEAADLAEIQLEDWSSAGHMTRLRHELAEAGLSQLAHAIIEDLGIESVEGLREFTFDELKGHLKAEAGVALTAGQTRELKAFLAASPSGTSSAFAAVCHAGKAAYAASRSASACAAHSAHSRLASAFAAASAASRSASAFVANSAASRSAFVAAMRTGVSERTKASPRQSSMEVAPNSALPSSQENIFVVTFHLSTFDEVAPLTAASLQGKAEAVKKRLDEFGAEDIEIIKGKPFLPRCQDMPADAFLSPERAADLFARGRRGVSVVSYCRRSPGVPDPDGHTLEKIRGKVGIGLKLKADPQGRIVVTAIATEDPEPKLAVAADAVNFTHTFTEQLGLKLKADSQGRVVVEGYVPDAPSASKSIPTGAILEKVNGMSTAKKSVPEVMTMLTKGKRHITLEFSPAQPAVGDRGLFVEFACLPQNFAWPSWHAPEAVPLRFGSRSVCGPGNGHFVDQGPLTVLKFECERVVTEDEAQDCVDKLVSLCEEQKWALASMADFKSLGLQSRGHASVLFHGRYISGEYHFDEGADAEGYMRFRTSGDADMARHNSKLKRMCGGKEPKLMGEHVFENELKFKRGLSVMGSLYASATGTCVLQLTDPPGKLDHDGAPSELVSERTGTVFVVELQKLLKELGDKSLDELQKVLQEELQMEIGDELLEELGDSLLACEKKGSTGELVVRVLGERAARAVRSLNERGYPLRRKDRVVFPMYNLRPYGSRGWPTFEKTAASIVLAHLRQHKRRGGALPPPVAQAEASSPKFINIDLIGAPREVVVAQEDGSATITVEHQQWAETAKSVAIVHWLWAQCLNVVTVKWFDTLPERLLRECKKNLCSERIFFTGHADRKQVVQLLSDFEDSIAVEFDQKRAEHLKLRTEDLEDALTADMREARRSRSRKMVQRLIVHVKPMRILHVSEPEPEPAVGASPDAELASVAAEPPPAADAPLQRYPISSSVFVTRRNGEVTLAYVKEYDAVKQVYTLDLEQRGSRKLEECDETSLREPSMLEGILFTARGILFSARAMFSSERVDDGLVEASVAAKAPEPKLTLLLANSPGPDTTNRSLSARVIDSDRSFVAEALEPRYPFSSSVFVKRRNGEETLAYVKEYDAANKIYTVELEQLGSMKLKKCDEKGLREANMLEAMFSPVAMFFSTRAMSSPAHIDNDLYDA